MGTNTILLKLRSIKCSYYKLDGLSAEFPGIPYDKYHMMPVWNYIKSLFSCKKLCGFGRGKREICDIKLILYYEIIHKNVKHCWKVKKREKHAWSTSSVWKIKNLINFISIYHNKFCRIMHRMNTSWFCINHHVINISNTCFYATWLENHYTCTCILFYIKYKSLWSMKNVHMFVTSFMLLIWQQNLNGLDWVGHHNRVYCWVDYMVYCAK